MTKNIKKLPPTLKISGTILKEDKNSILYTQLNKYFEKDILILREHPDPDVNKLFQEKSKYKYGILNLSGLPDNIKIQLKIYIRNELKRLCVSYSILNNNLLRPLSSVLPYMKSIEKDDIIFYSDDELYFNYIVYYHNHYRLKDRKEDFNILRKLKYFSKCYQQNHLPNIWDRDIWDVNELNLSSERLNNSDSIIDINFWEITNDCNKQLLKAYIKNELALTSKAYSSIYQSYKRILCFIVFLGDTNIGDHTREDILSYYKLIDKHYTLPSAYNRAIASVVEFLNYLYKSEFIKSESFIYSSDYKKVAKYNYKFTAPDDFIIYQIFNKLPLAEPIYQVMYLIQTWSGIRISELCCLPFNCIRKDPDSCKLFIRSQKMQDNDYVIIPKALYEKIKSYQAIVKKTLPNAKYLFYSPGSKKHEVPISSHRYSSQMKKYMKQWGIKNPDGSDYDYSSHSYRHKKGKDMVEAGIPIYLISQCLNHKSYDMTLAYAEARTEFRKKEFSKYISATKDVDPLKNDSKITVEWLRDNLDKQSLPNGYCCLPCQASCPHNNNCIHCDNFVTSTEYLDIHKKQLTALEIELNNYEQNGYLANAATTRKDIDALKDIIKRLEES